MNIPEGQKGGVGRDAALRKEKQKSIKYACGVWIIYIIAAVVAAAAQFLNMQIAMVLVVIGVAGFLLILKLAADLSKLKDLQGVGQYQYDQIKQIAAEKEWMTLLVDVFIMKKNEQMTLWLTVVTGGNVYMYVPEQNLSSEEIEAEVAGLIGDENGKRRIYAYENFDEYEDMIRMLAANKPMKKEDDSKQVCEGILRDAR